LGIHRRRLRRLGCLVAIGHGDHAAGGGCRSQDDRCNQQPSPPPHPPGPPWPPTTSATRWPHLRIAALRMVIPPGLLEDGIRVVSTMGWPLTGSGKSFTPFARMHRANSRAADNCLGLRCALKEPGGCSSLHAASAFVHTAGLTLIPKLGNSPEAFGSGKSGYPFSRMHAANFTALSRAVAFLLLAVLLPPPVLLAGAPFAGGGGGPVAPPVWGPPPPPALHAAPGPPAAGAPT